MNNPIKTLTKREWCLWIGSLGIVLISNALTAEFDVLTLVAALIGVTSLIFAAKGNVWAQILMVIFSILYGIISFRFRYWGEMITYLGMTMPMSVWSMITWLNTPNIIFSTISIITSFLATSLTMLRSSYYAVGYAANDIVLIVLWVLASMENPVYIPVVVNFAIFFLNDMYGFISWKKRELRQA